MDIAEIKKDLEKYDSIREKVLRLNEICEFESIVYGAKYIWCYGNDDEYKIIIGNGGCRFCLELSGYDNIVQLKSKNFNNVRYYTCYYCMGKALCAYCLCEKENCNHITKQKITFWLCTKNIFPKDIQRLIIKLLFKN